MAESQQTTANLISKVKKLTKGGWSNAKGITPREQGMTLPGGIRGGVARLTSYKIGESDDKDKSVFVSFRGVVFLPKEHETERFFKTIYISDRPEYNKTMQDALNEISACFQNLGVDTANMTEDHWEQVLQQLCAVKRSFSYHTWQPEDSDRVSTFIDPPQKKLDNYPDLDANEQVAGAEEPQVAAPPPAITKPAGKPSPAAKPNPRANPAPAKSTREVGKVPPRGPVGKAAAAAAPEPEPEGGGSFLEEVIAAQEEEGQTIDFGGTETVAAEEVPWVPDVGTVYNFFTGKLNADQTEVLHEVEIVSVTADGLKFTGKSTTTQKVLPNLLVSNLR